MALHGWPPAGLPDALIERLSTGEANLVREIAAQAGPPAEPAGSVRTLKCLRYERERADLQREIARLQEAGGAAADQEIEVLHARKIALLRRIEGLLGEGARNGGRPTVE
jgi:hypothetical protein